ncbi:hypothetical protein N7493_000242 [Penicillium malachiteum]|uniref:Uncharacterized protein n=1 Tax=Penicillium malachiteum TaxID=1324776 RepID=A0AAD6HVY7_9EURO|nr:hypothetical protein N7493_000242 [Penicillium malachiteum]
MGLHYTVWQSNPVMKSAFVTLAVLDKPTCARTQLMLNLAEIWGYLIFQTLKFIHLDSWLPGNTAALWSGHHLNVALPLWQGFTDTSENQAISDAIGGRDTFQGFLASSDPVIRAWAEETRDAFNDIRNSPDPNIREYWWSFHQSRILKSQKTWADKKAEVALRHLEGLKLSLQVDRLQPMLVQSTLAVFSLQFRSP